MTTPHQHSAYGSALLIAVLLLTTAPLGATGDYRVVARSGDQAPDAPGGALFLRFGTPVLNETGQVAFLGVLQPGSGGVTSSNSNGIWRDNTLIARAGFQAPGTPAGVLFDDFFDPVLNDAGQTAFRAFLQTDVGGVTFSNDLGIWRDGTLIAWKGFQAPDVPNGAVFSNLHGMVLNNTGQVAFQGSLEGGGVLSSNNSAIWRDSTVVARRGFQAPGTPAGALFSLFDGPVLNNIGQTAFRGGLQFGTGGVTTGNETGIWRDDTLLAREGFQAPGAPPGALFSDFRSPPSLNDAGQVAYRGALQIGAGGVTSTNNNGLWRDDTLIVRSGDQAPGTATGALFSTFGNPVLNNAGQVAFDASLQIGVGGVTGSNSFGLWRDSTLIARRGFQAPGTPAGALFLDFFIPVLNDTGQVAYIGILETGAGGVIPENDRGLWLAGSNGDNLLVAREGDAFDGKVLSSVTLKGEIGESRGHGRGLNTFSQLIYHVGFTNGDEAIVLFTPELHWLADFSSNWESSALWTLGQAPALVHDVVIDPSVDLTVSGPTASESVNHLTIGGGTGIATLRLEGGNLAALTGVDIAASGVLTGEGTISGTVTNHGELRARNVTIAGGELINFGQIRGQSAGLNRINAVVNNQNGGEIGLLPGESLHLTQGGHTNSGNVNVNDGELEVDGAFNNLAAGHIQAHNASLRFSGGLSNAGQLQLTFGDSDVFGLITNQATGTLINSGSGSLTFHDDIANNGELQTSSTGQTLLFGSYSGTGVITGSGSTFFEGGFSPGASPFLASASTDVSFGTANVSTIELAGNQRDPGTASEYDGLDITGGKTLSLGGTLNVVLIDDLTLNYQPGLGDIFLLFTAANILGDFHTVNLPGLSAGLMWEIVRDAQQYALTVNTAVPLPPALWLFLSALGVLARRWHVPANDQT